MRYNLGIDIGGTFTDIIAVADDGATIIHKTPSTPSNPSIGFMNGITHIAGGMEMSLREFLARIDTIVHGTTVATNALLTGRGSVTALITTEGFRDALEMRRGIREEQYNNRYRNVEPLVPRFLRYGLAERTDSAGKVHKAPVQTDVDKIVSHLKEHNVASVAVCFMNSYRNARNEERVLAWLRKKLPDVFVIGSCEVLPTVRFYERVSTTVVSAFVGPIVATYLDNLQGALASQGYKGNLLIMQSNGGVVSPSTVRRNPAVTVLSGPAAAPTAGAWYGQMLGYPNSITVDMGGTSFDAAVIFNYECATTTDGGIDKHRIALPSLDIVTIGAGGGSIGSLTEGGLLLMGPASAGADPGPVCYDRGGLSPTCTDADLILGYLDPDFFAGGSIKLDKEKAESAIANEIAKPLNLPVWKAAAGMYRIINGNMAHGVRQVSVERGYDPREFLLIVSGGAGPIHAAEICAELEIPLFLVPAVSSIFCASGMLLGDLKRDYARACVTSFDALDKPTFTALFQEMRQEGLNTLMNEEGIKRSRISFHPSLNMRYRGQYHEVTLNVEWSDTAAFRLNKIYDLFHDEHSRQFGYNLKEEGTPMELINAGLRVVGRVERPSFLTSSSKADVARARKGTRVVFVPETDAMQDVPIYDGDKPLAGVRINGPCIIEKVTTTILVSADYACVADPFGSFLVYNRKRYPNGPEVRKTVHEN